MSYCYKSAVFERLFPFYHYYRGGAFASLGNPGYG